MGLYLDIISKSIKKTIIYRFNVWTKLLGKIMYFFVQISVWSALYSSQIIGNNSNTLQNMLLYVTISNVISVIVEFNIIEFINQKIRNGDIALDLIKPFNFISYIFCYGLGENMVNLITQAIPLILCSLFFININIASGSTLVFFLISLALAIIISFLFAFWIGILAFFFMVTWPLNMLLRSIYKLLSGSWIPIWLFPDSLKIVNKFLPFQYIYYIPSSILTTNDCNILECIVSQVLWCIILIQIMSITWKLGRKKLVIQGG